MNEYANSQTRQNFYKTSKLGTDGSSKIKTQELDRLGSKHKQATVPCLDVNDSSFMSSSKKGGNKVNFAKLDEVLLPLSANGNSNGSNSQETLTSP